MSFELVTSTSSTALLANVVTVFGENIPALLLLGSAVIAIPLGFYVTQRVIGLFNRTTAKR